MRLIKLPKINMDEAKRLKKAYDKSLLAATSRNDGINADGHYDETKDFTFMKRLKLEYPELAIDFEKILKDHNEKLLKKAEDKKKS